LLVAVLTPFQSGAAAADPASRYGQCMALAQTNPQQALETANAWTNQGGGDADAAGHCAAASLMGLKRYTEAAKGFEALAQNSSAQPGLRAALLGQAGQAWLMGRDPNQAEAALTRAITLAPTDAALLVDRAQAKFDLQRYRAAVADLDAALIIDPDLVDAYVFRASAYRQLDDLEKAKADADKALSLDSAHPEALLERGMIHKLKGDKVAARRDWLTLITVAPDTEAARIARANLDRMDAGIKFD
jgi:tetratricopeptide (TPR) repeat protein